MAIFEVISKVLPSDLKSVGVLPDCCDSGRSGMLKAVGLCVLICSYWIQRQQEAVITTIFPENPESFQKFCELDDVDKANIVAIEELKSKLHGKEDNENCDMNVLKELNQAKTNLCKTTVDLAAICESVELLNKRLEEERAALEKTRERLNSENAAEISKEIQRLSDDVLEFSKTGKMKEAARVAEAVAIAEIKDVTRSSRTRETLHEETLEKIEEMAQEIRSSKRTIEEGLERVNSAKMEAEE
ncbi:unnamed protein product [Brassica oleracea var. botrytis]